MSVATIAWILEMIFLGLDLYKIEGIGATIFCLLVIFVVLELGTLHLWEWINKDHSKHMSEIINERQSIQQKIGCYNPIERDAILNKVINWGIDNNCLIPYNKLKSFDSMYDENYKENFENFVKENSIK